MTQYVVRPRALLLDDPDLGTSATAGEIIMSDGDFAETGLLNADGAPLYRCRERIRLGFRAAERV